ncbi:MAG: YraN family protein [bacterium]|nr:YraN family protein [bacterium]
MKSRQHHIRKGILSEILALWFLRFKGYRLLKRRWRTPVGEIDLLMKKGNILAIIEVKYRQTYTQAVESIHPHQQRRLSNAGQLAWQRYGNSKTTVRFDAFIVHKGKWPQHLVDCW